MWPRRRVIVGSLVAIVAFGLAAPAAAQDQSADAPATQLRVALDRMLGEHAFLSMEVMRTGIAGGEAFTAAAEVLDANSTEIIAAIEGVYGAAAAAAFGQQWRNHIAYLVDYGRALSRGDTAAAELATTQLNQYVADFSALLTSAMPGLPEDAVKGLIEEHVQQLAHVAAFFSARFGDAYPAIRETYRHTFAVGDALAIGIVGRFPERFTGREVAFSPATDLRIALDRLLGEHTYLAALAMGARLTMAPDAESATDAVNQNSAELQQTIADIYGAPAGEAFGALWTDHVASYLAYVDALRSGDELARAAALAALADYREGFTAFLAGANPYVTAADLMSLLEEHTDLLVLQADRFAAGEEADAYQVGRDAFAHTGELSTSLAGAIADQFPQRFPDAASDGQRAPVLPLVGVAMAGLAAGWLLGFRMRRRSGASAEGVTPAP